MKKLFAMLLALALTLSLSVPLAGAAYTDVPSSSSLAGEVQKATEYGLMQGYNTTTFGYSDPMTRAQFVTVLDRMMAKHAGAENLMNYISREMEVPRDISSVYWSSINHAVTDDIVDNDVPFRPYDPITRGEMAEMLVRALGLKSVAVMVERENNLPFTDVSERAGYISIAYDIGMTKGTSATTFAPNATATRAQAAAMLVRIYEKLHQSMDFIHGFYAISSYSQLSIAEQMDSVSVGWSRMTWDGEEALLSTTSANGNEYYIPSGYQEVTASVKNLNLSVFMDTSDGVSKLLASADGRSQAVEQILNELTVAYKTIGKNPYCGVTIDFEGLRKGQKEDFTTFLKKLKPELDKLNKSLYVCVSPVLTTGDYYDGYDYAAIADLADKVILMAYDYDTRNLSDFIGTEYYKTAATVPIDQLYASLKALTDAVKDTSKLAVGLSCKQVAWEIDEDGKLVSGKPLYPSTETVVNRLVQKDTQFGFSKEYQQSYAIYTTEEGKQYFLWYQNDSSVTSVLQTGKLLGVTGVSVWRLGNIPCGDDWNWNSLLCDI